MKIIRQLKRKTKRIKLRKIQLNKIKFILFYIIILFNVRLCLGQDCVCKNNYGYDTAKLNNINISNCFKDCHILADRISILYKLNDFGNNCLILPDQEYLNRISSSENYMSAKHNLLNYLQNPFFINFLGQKRIEDTVILKNSIEIQKVIIDTKEVYIDSEYVRFGSFGGKSISTDTIYISGINNPIFLSSRYINSELFLLLNEKTINDIYLKSIINKNNYSKYLEYYYKILKLRNIRILKIESKNNSEFIVIENYDTKIYIILNKKNIKTMLKKIINGGRFEEMW